MPQEMTYTTQVKVNALPARSSGRLQVKGGAPKGCDKELRPLFVSPSGVDIVPERSEWDGVRVATAGRGVQR